MFSLQHRCGDLSAGQPRQREPHLKGTHAMAEPRQPRQLLQLTKAEEERLLKEMKKRALAKCDSYVKGAPRGGRSLTGKD